MLICNAYLHVVNLYGDESRWFKSFKRTSAGLPITGNVVRGRQQGHEGIAYIITGFSGIDGHAKMHTTAETHSKCIVIIVLDTIIYFVNLLSDSYIKLQCYKLLCSEIIY